MRYFYTRNKIPKESDENITKILLILSEIDITIYSKTTEVIMLNIALLKIAFENYFIPIKTNQMCINISITMQIFSKLFDFLEKQKDQHKDMKEKSIKFFKHIFSLHIDFFGITQQLYDNKEYFNLFLSSLTGLIQSYISLIKQNENKPEYKLSLQSFSMMINDINPVILEHSKSLKDTKDHYLLPQLFSFILELIEKYAGREAIT